MITAIDVENFKCFTRLRLPFGSLTLLTGFNGGGKSSALQPLLLLSQNLFKASAPEIYTLNGPLVRLGTVADVLPANTGKSQISFTVSAPENEIAWTFAARAGDRFLRAFELKENSRGSPPKWSPARVALLPRVVESLTTLTYLSAVREGTADAFPLPDVDTERLGDVGMDGRFASYWYDKTVDDEVPEPRRHPTERATTMRKQLDAWLGTLFPEAQANVQLLPQALLLSLQFRLSGIGAWRRPANVGYGLTYVFPILVALLTVPEGEIVIIDSPEAHLHPYGQSQMGRLLAHFAAAGVQIIVETHSDHLLNGSRLAVKEGQLDHDAMQIHFFMGANSAQHGVVSPAIDQNGRIHEWPGGFFDQSEKDLSQLAGW